MNGILLVNKPKGMTSHDVVNKLRRILHMKKIGHTGTLDPNAEGVLMVLLGNSCKILPFIKNDIKEYVAKMTFGYTSDTLDIWGNLEEFEVESYPTVDEVKDVMTTFMGKQLQIPPMVSAIKVNGKKLYEYAREGIEIERKAREIEIFELDLLSYDKDIELRCLCSSGTYIRSLCVDIAEKLGQKGVLSSLVRTRIDQFTLDQTYTLEQIENGEYSLLTNYEVLNKYPYIVYNKIEDVKNGKRIQLPCRDDMVMIVSGEEVIAAYQHVNNGIYEAKRGLW
ncbi:MAG: tRNA pseudouridine(55) synthase TruB [Erysipelotrichaceae bacterium]|nr:tRNA pseudouridine(55) synthase TruB [Erysipelotrichaceae bacterium]